MQVFASKKLRDKLTTDRLTFVSPVSQYLSSPAAQRPELRFWGNPFDHLGSSPPDAFAGALCFRRLSQLAPTLLIFLAALISYTTAQAEVTIWTATLTPTQISGGVITGCDNAESSSALHCSNTSVLSNDEFTYDATVYSITAITYIPAGGTIAVTTNTRVPQVFFDLGKFDVGNVSVPVSGQLNQLVKYDSAPSGLMTAGTAVTVKIVLDAVQVSLTPTSMRVNEGGERGRFQAVFSGVSDANHGLIPLVSEDRCTFPQYHSLVSGISFTKFGGVYSAFQDFTTGKVPGDTVCTIRVDSGGLPDGFIVGPGGTLTVTIVDTAQTNTGGGNTGGGNTGGNTGGGNNGGGNNGGGNTGGGNTGGGNTGGGNTGGGNTGGGNTGGGNTGGGNTGGGNTGGGNTGGGNTGGGGGGSVNVEPTHEAPTIAKVLKDATLRADMELEIELADAFDDPDGDELEFEATSSDDTVAAVGVDGDTLTVYAISRDRGIAMITVTAKDLHGESASQTFAVTLIGPSMAWYLPPAADTTRQGFVRVLNHSDESGHATITAADDLGRTYPPLTLALEPREAVHFTTADLESGNLDKRLTGATGPGTGAWRLVIDSETLDIEALAYIRTTDAVFAGMNAVAPLENGALSLALFNPGSELNHISLLRLVNPTKEDAEATVTAIDDTGHTADATVHLKLSAGSACNMHAAQLESG